MLTIVTFARQISFTFIHSLKTSQSEIHKKHASTFLSRTSPSKKLTMSYSVTIYTSISLFICLPLQRKLQPKLVQCSVSIQNQGQKFATNEYSMAQFFNVLIENNGSGLKFLKKFVKILVLDPLKNLVQVSQVL